MTPILVILILIIITILWLIGRLLNSMFGLPGLIIPILLILLVVSIVHYIGIPKILGTIAAVVIIRKVREWIEDRRYKRRLNSSHINTRVYRGRYDLNEYSDSDNDEYDGYINPVLYYSWKEQERIAEMKANARRKRMTNNCPNCGGLVSGGICPYCNTKLT